MTTIDLILKIVSATSTLVIGIAASVLAYQQFRINRAKLKLDLYEKRLALFRTANEFIELLCDDSFREPDKIRRAANKFTRDTVEVRFLFESNIWTLFHGFHLQAWELARIEDQRKKSDSPELHRQAIEVRTNLVGEGIDLAETLDKDLGIRALR